MTHSNGKIQNLVDCCPTCLMICMLCNVRRLYTLSKLAVDISICTYLAATIMLALFIFTFAVILFKSRFNCLGFLLLIICLFVRVCFGFTVDLFAFMLLNVHGGEMAY